MLKSIKFKNIYGLRLCLSLMMIFVFSFAAHAQTNFSTSYSTFNVGGTSVEQIWKSIQKNGPRSKLGIGHAGYTTFDLKSPVKFVTKNGKCHISAAKFTMVSSIQLPKWVDQTIAPESVRIFWKALYTDVKRHEEDHVRIAEAAITRLAKSVKSLKPQRNCDVMNRKISRLASANRRQLNRAQNKFERAEMRGQRKRIADLIQAYSLN
ncbi:MAG: DUF922 domain-containing protein [Rhizobiaceae bacterium]|nr:DUF922 domain-containing protein [Rhizobiaceae bacterium]